MLIDRAGGDDMAQCVEFVIEHLAHETPMAFLAQVNLSVTAREPGFDPSLPTGMVRNRPAGALLFCGVKRVDWNDARHRRSCARPGRRG